MGVFSRIFRKGFSVSINTAVNDPQPNFIYREGKRTMRIAGETLADGYAVYAASIKEWENHPEDIVEESDRQRIASNIQQYLTSKGKNVYLSY